MSVDPFLNSTVPPMVTVPGFEGGVTVAVKVTLVAAGTGFEDEISAVTVPDLVTLIEAPVALLLAL